MTGYVRRDKKYEELLKCVEDLIKAMEHEFEVLREEAQLLSIMNTAELKALKVYLPPPPPSRSEIADYWEAESEVGDIKDEQCLNYIDWTIEELRK